MTALRNRFGALEFQEYALAIVVVVLFVVGAILKPDTFPTQAGAIFDSRRNASRASGWERCTSTHGSATARIAS